MRLCKSQRHDLDDDANFYINAAGDSYCIPCKRERDREYVRTYRARRKSATEPLREVGLWVERAACSGVDPEIFFDQTRWATAAELCGLCPVRLHCRETYLHEPFGYFGGSTPEQRDNLRRRRRKGEPAPLNLPAPRAYNTTKCTLPTGQDAKSEILRLYMDKGWGLRRISKDLNIARSTIQRVIKDAGVQRTEEQRRLNVEGRPVKYETETSRMIWKLLDEDDTQSTARLAFLAGCSDNTVVRQRKLWREKRDEDARNGLFDGSGHGKSRTRAGTGRHE